MPGEIDMERVCDLAPFKDLSPLELAAALDRFELVEFKTGQVIFKERDSGEAAYVLLKGYVDIMLSVPDEEDHRLAALTPGSIFGEVSLLTDEARTASVVSRTAAEAVKIPAEVFRDGLAKREAWTFYFLHAAAQELARRLTAVDHQLVGLVVDLREWEAQGAGPDAREIEELRRELFEHWAV